MDVLNDEQAYEGDYKASFVGGVIVLEELDDIVIVLEDD